MFEKIISFIEEKAFENEWLVIDEVNALDSKKLSVVLTCYDVKMVSIELLSNGVCDLLIIEFDSEQIIYSNTVEVDSFISLRKEIEELLKICAQSANE